MSASLVSTSSQVCVDWPFGLLKAYEISAVCVAPYGDGLPLSVGIRVKKYV